jgi:hypothetical protein
MIACYGFKLIIMQYRSKHQYDITKITDIFDGAHYCSLLETPVTISDEELPMWFFSDPRDIALGFSTDSSSATRLLGPLSFSITIFLLKKGFKKKYYLPQDNTWTQETC